MAKKINLGKKNYLPKFRFGFDFLPKFGLEKFLPKFKFGVILMIVVKCFFLFETILLACTN